MTDLYADGTPECDERFLTEDEECAEKAKEAELFLLEHTVVVNMIREAIKHHEHLYKNPNIADWIIEYLNEDDNVCRAEMNYENEYDAKWEYVV